MNDEHINSMFDEMTAGLDLELDGSTVGVRSDVPFTLTADGTISVNIDSQIRLLLGAAAQNLHRRLVAAEMTPLPTPQVDGDPDDDFGALSAQTLTDIRTQRLGELMESIHNSEIEATTAHAWIGAANDIRLDVRATIDNATGDLNSDAELEDPSAIALAALIHDLAGAVSSALIAALKG